MPFSFPELRDNLAAKLEHPDFRADLETLVVRTPDGYDPTAAADLVIDRLGVQLANAPTQQEVANGAWRQAQG